MRNVVLVLVALVFLGGVGGYVLLNRAAAPSSSSPPESTLVGTPDNISRYVTYSPAVLEQAAENRRVLFFYANWCPTCRPANTEFNTKAMQIPQDVTLIRVNYNDSDTDADEEALAERYGITYQHTFVQIDANSDEVTKWNGGQLDELLANIE